MEATCFHIASMKLGTHMYLMNSLAVGIHIESTSFDLAPVKKQILT